MIYWIYGQAGNGKTTLAKRLKKEFDSFNDDFQTSSFIHLDGDALRVLFGNSYSKEHFTKEYRIEQTKLLQRFVAYLADQGVNVIVSTVNPYRDVREEFKKSRKDVKEIYVYCPNGRVRVENWCKDFEEPLEENKNTIWINTKGKTEDESFRELFSKL